jgi:hypothetical protein
MNLNQIEIKIIMKFPLYCFILWTPYDLKNKNKACSFHTFYDWVSPRVPSFISFKYVP